jgi:hypothetical protein
MRDNLACEDRQPATFASNEPFEIVLAALCAETAKTVSTTGIAAIAAAAIIRQALRDLVNDAVALMCPVS